MRDLELELKHLIVDSLLLDDVKAEEIDSDAPLFADGLGLDSIDALELGMALNRKYGIEIRSDDEGIEDVLGSVRNLAAFLERQNTQRGSIK